MFASPAFAQSAGGAASGGASSTLFFLGQFVLIGVIFYFLMIRPQQKRVKEHKAKLDAVKKGDEVITGGGLHGKVVKVDDEAVEIEIAPGVKVKAVKSMLTDVRARGAVKPAND